MRLKHKLISRIFSREEMGPLYKCVETAAGQTADRGVRPNGTPQIPDDPARRPRQQPPNPGAARPFMILGCPRSGTNLLQDLVAGHPQCEVQNEPFSMHTAFTRVEDLVAGGTIARRLGCRCQHCLPCQLRRWLRAGPVRGFKETALFAHLDLLDAWMPELRVVFINRATHAIVRSHLRDGLDGLWNIAASQAATLDDTAASSPETLIRRLTDMRKALWATHRDRFERIEINYEDLVASPREVVGAVMAFVGLELCPQQEQSIRMRTEADYGRVSPYGTFGRSGKGTSALAAT